MRSAWLRWLLVALLALFVAYVLGRAAGILLGVEPIVTSAVAVAIVVVVIASRRPS